MTAPPSPFVGFCEAIDLIVGAPSYRRYREHMAERHPDQTPMTRGQFFNTRQDARYGGQGGGRCC